VNHGLFPGVSSLAMLSSAKSRSITAENPTGRKGGGGRDVEGISAERAEKLGPGWKINPAVMIQPGQTFDMADITGPGSIQHVWMTPGGHWRFLILRIYWDDQDVPSVECPVGDFFAAGWGHYWPLSSLAVCVNPGSALNCYWPMPFRQRCRMTLENIAAEEVVVYYQVDYALDDVANDAAYFHAQFRRVNPVPEGRVYTILDRVAGRGHYVGTYMAWGSNSGGWWGEGEIKFYLDGDLGPDPVGDQVAEHGGDRYPTICGTGTEDYFCGSYNFDPSIPMHKKEGRYEPFATPYAGLQVLEADGAYRSQQRFGMYRWHIPDPIRFETDLAVTIQALGWRREPPLRYRPLHDDLASVAYWYQTLPTPEFLTLPGRDQLEVD